MSQSSDFDFENALPANREFFRIRELAALWRCSELHIHRLVESGALAVLVDLRSPKATKTMHRITRKSVVDFLNSRKTGAQ